MGYGLIIGAIANIAGSAIGAATSGSGSISAPNVNLTGINLADPNQAGLGAFINQQQQWPALTGFTNQINQAATTGYTGLLNQLYPGATTQLGQISSLANAYQQGQIPADMQAQVQRATAQQALAGGYGAAAGAAAGMEGALTSRDLGLTSLELTQLGTNMFTTGVGAAKGMIPGYLNPAQLLFSPSQLLARTDQAAYYNTDVQNQQQIINAQLAMQANAINAGIAQQQGSMFSSLGANLGNLFGSSSGQSGFSNLFGGGGGGIGGAGYNIPTASTPVGISLGPGD